VLSRDDCAIVVKCDERYVDSECVGKSESCSLLLYPEDGQQTVVKKGEEIVQRRIRRETEGKRKDEKIGERVTA